MDRHVDLEERERKALEVIKHNAKNRLKRCRPETTSDQYDLFEYDYVPIAGNEYSTVPDRLHWYSIELPELDEEKRILHFLRDSTPNPEEQRLLTAPDPEETRRAKRQRRGADPSSLFTNNALRIPSIKVTEMAVKSMTSFEEVQTELTNVKSISLAKVSKLLDCLEDRLVYPNGKGEAVQASATSSPACDMTRQFLHIFGLPESEGLNVKKLEENYSALRAKVQNLKIRFKEEENEALFNRCRNILNKYSTVYNAFIFSRKYYRENKIQAEGPEHLKKFIALDAETVPTFEETGLKPLMVEEDMKKIHYAILYYLDFAYARGFHKAGFTVYQPKRISTGQPTLECEYYGDMNDFINLGMGKGEADLKSTMFMWMTEGTMRTQVINALVAINTSKFPSLHKSRNCFSFLDGLYNTQFDRFLSYDEVNALPFEEMGVTVAKYHEVEFMNEIYEMLLAKTDGDWYSLPTPYLFKLFDAQGYSEEVKRFLCMCGGRMLQRLGTDNWQFILWCIGKAGTGKTTFAQIFALIFDKGDVGTLSQICEPRFGMQPFVDPHPKFCVIAPDLSKGVGLPLPIFLNWISAESICIPRKGLSALEMEMDMPLMICSNIIALDDVKDALARRTAFLKFDKTIRKSNTRLLDYIRQYELPAILKKFTMAYWDYFARFVGTDPWAKGFFPDYFRETRAEMAAEANSIRYFLRKSGLVDIITQEIRDVHAYYDQLVFTPFSTLQGEYTNWLKTLTKKESDKALKWNESARQVLEELGCRLFQFTGYWPPIGDPDGIPSRLYNNAVMVDNCCLVSIPQLQLEAADKEPAAQVDPPAQKKQKVRKVVEVQYQDILNEEDVALVEDEEGLGFRERVPNSQEQQPPTKKRPNRTRKRKMTPVLSQ